MTVLGSLGLRCWFLKAMLENLEAMLGHLEAMLGHVEGLGSASCGSVISFWKLCRAIWRPCWDYVRQLVARYVGTLLGSFGLSWQLLKAMLGHLGATLRLCWAAGALLAVFESYVGPLGGHVGTMFGNFCFCWRFLEAMLGHLEAMLRLCSATCGSIGGFWRLCSAI